MTKDQDICTTGIQQFRDGMLKLKDDQICSEEPLEIRVPFRNPTNEVKFKTLAITMRTPGNDIDLARGFLFSEGIIKSADDISDYQYNKERGDAGYRNSLELKLLNPLPVESPHLDRRFTTYSSCGLCGKTTIQSLELLDPPRLDETQGLIEARTLKEFAAVMLKQQTIFQQTGSAHASGLFDKSGDLIILREDIGRHNALDKLIGHCLKEKTEQLKQSILLVSGRASFELVQKTILAGIPIMAAAGAPSSLAVETAKRFNLTLVGFLRSSGFNVYNAGWRLKTAVEE